MELHIMLDFDITGYSFGVGVYRRTRDADMLIFFAIVLAATS